VNRTLFLLVIASAFTFVRPGSCQPSLLGQPMSGIIPSSSADATRLTTEEISTIRGHLRRRVYTGTYYQGDAATARAASNTYLRNMSRPGNEWTARFLTDVLALRVDPMPCIDDDTVSESRRLINTAEVFKFLPRGKGREVAFLPLVQLMADGHRNAEGRLRAGEVLAQWMDDAAPNLPVGVSAVQIVPILRGVIENRTDFTVRRQAIVICGKFGPAAGTADPNLVAVLTDIRDGDGEDELKPAARTALDLINPSTPPPPVP
jgi:hypothetical protein